MMHAMKVAGENALKFVKNPIVVAVASAAAGASVKYGFESTTLSRDLKQARSKVQELESRLLTLESENSELVKHNRDLAGHNTNYADRCNRLLDELRQANTYIADAKDNLTSCQKKVDACEEISKNTWSLWKNNAYNNCSDRKPELDNQPNTAVRDIKK